MCASRAGSEIDEGLREAAAQMEKKTQFNVWYIILALFAILLFQNWWAASRQIEVIAYSQFEELLEAGKIEEVYVRQNRLEGKLKEPSANGRQRFVTFLTHKR